MAVSYFFDSYAIVELLKRNLAYEPYADQEVTITIFNLAEIYWYGVLKLSVPSARRLYDRFKTCVADIDDATLREAIEFRLAHKKRNLSYADCIGYIYAKRNGMKFLTGDKEFADLPCVEFVK